MRETFEQLVARVNAGSFIPQPRSIVMAKPVHLKKGKEFNFKAATSVNSKYPWDEWFNGDLLMLEKDTSTDKKDFSVDVDAMGPKLRTAARRRYKIVQISRIDADGNKLKDALIIKARDMMADEHIAEDLKRAEEKEARKAAGESELQDADTATTEAA